MEYIKRDDAIKMLTKWKNNELSELELYEWANEKYNNILLDKLDFNDYEDDNCSVMKEVLQYLESMNMNLIIKDDIPSLLDFLNSPNGEFKNSYAIWKKYNDAIDYLDRKKKLKNTPFYSKFCKS